MSSLGEIPTAGFVKAVMETVSVTGGYPTAPDNEDDDIPHCYHPGSNTDDDVDPDDDCVHCECCCNCLGCEYGPRNGMLMFPEWRAQ